MNNWFRYFLCETHLLREQRLRTGVVFAALITVGVLVYGMDHLAESKSSPWQMIGGFVFCLVEWLIWQWVDRLKFRVRCFAVDAFALDRIDPKVSAGIRDWCDANRSTDIWFGE